MVERLKALFQNPPNSLRPTWDVLLIPAVMIEGREQSWRQAHIDRDRINPGAS